MLLFLFFILVCCAVKCDYVSNNYYIIEMPEAETPKDYNTPFKVYWNVPTKQCVSRKVVFDNLAKFGIIQNQNDSFEGGRITIMYDPGVFPAIFKTDSGKYRYRNGGVPQQGNLELHLTAFRESINKSIPNPNFSGAGVIDFESWRPIFRQQFGSLKPYIDLSMNIEKRRHWWWPTAWQKMEATKRFEDAARVFMQTTLSIAKQMRPRAIWGYYAFPYCYNMASNNLVENCSAQIKGENNKIYWLWAESTALYPSVYSSANLSTSQLAALVRGRVTEANRVKKSGTLVLPYFWFRYRDAGYMKEADVLAVFEALKKTGASGLIIWGSSSDVDQTDKCDSLQNYVETILGPIIKNYTEQINKANNDIKQSEPEIDEDYNDTKLTTTEAITTVQVTSISTIETIETTTSKFLDIGIELGLSLLPKQNYSNNTSQYSNESNENFNKSDANGAGSNVLSEGSFWDIFKNLFNTEKESKQTIRSAQKENNTENIEQNNIESYFETETKNNETSTNTSTPEIIFSEDNAIFSTISNDNYTTESIVYLNNKTSTDSTESTDFNDENDNTGPLEVDLTPSVITSVSTYEDKSVIHTFTEKSTDTSSSENFIIIRDNQEEDSVNAAINVTQT